MLKFTTTLMKDSRHAGLLVKDSRHALINEGFKARLVYYLNEGFKACWFTTLMKDSRHAGLLP